MGQFNKVLLAIEKVLFPINGFIILRFSTSRASSKMGLHNIV